MVYLKKHIKISNLVFILMMTPLQAMMPQQPPSAQHSNNLDIHEINAPREGQEAANQCTVCLTALNDGRSVSRLTCGHAFHTDCVNPWLEGHNTCPICRQSVNVQPEIPVYIPPQQQQAGEPSLFDRVSAHGRYYWQIGQYYTPPAIKNTAGILAGLAVTVALACSPEIIATLTHKQENISEIRNAYKKFHFIKLSVLRWLLHIPIKFFYPFFAIYASRQSIRQPSTNQAAALLGANLGVASAIAYVPLHIFIGSQMRKLVHAPSNDTGFVASLLAAIWLSEVLSSLSKHVFDVQPPAPAA